MSKAKNEYSKLESSGSDQNTQVQHEYFILNFSDPLHVCPSWVCNTSRVDTARMERMWLGQADMQASRTRLAARQESTDAQLDAQYAYHIEHGGHGGPAMHPAVASAQMVEVEEVVQPKRQRKNQCVLPGAPDVVEEE